MDERIFAAFMAGICACQVAKWIVIAVQEFLCERKAKALAHLETAERGEGGQR